MLKISGQQPSQCTVVLWVVMLRKAWICRILYLHIDIYVGCIIMGSVQLDMEGGIWIVCLFSVEHVHLHLVVVALKIDKNRKY